MGLIKKVDLDLKVDLDPIFKPVEFEFYNFKPRTGVETFLNYNLEALSANVFDRKTLPTKNCKAFIQRLGDLFIFHVVLRKKSRIFQTAAEISIHCSQKWSREWQNGVTENLLADIMRQHDLWRKQFLHLK